MEPTPSPETSGSRKIVAGLAIVVLIAGAAYAFRAQWQRPSLPKAVTLLEPHDAADTLGRARRLAAIDRAKKTAWVDEVPGFDLARFSPSQREVFLRFANSERCTCGCGFTLGACRQYDSSCEVSLPRVTRLYDSVAAGQRTDAQGLRERPGGR